MGHRSWLTFVESKKEWLDLWRAITPRVERTNRDLQKSLDDFDYVPAFFSLNYVLSVVMRGSHIRLLGIKSAPSRPHKV
jgi:hypothetical protein